ncbi:hypothetical protein DAPPUDRAFT_305851 [Daphnia pulex]|uniref:Uncharacterized protein n=1 Tax=Daphnia pulex TaxID=6669 RepID=E9GT34_DAPPU|nr:hypothetical protein DAPPUDRAFT_305851 [Daphnia pulex]|eukprot:EFX77299.1 hypothetical protein DAPPUDRAFT_305851 [Daphnia pulex]
MTSSCESSRCGVSRLLNRRMNGLAEVNSLPNAEERASQWTTIVSRTNAAAGSIEICIER